ncbi:MAG: LPS-assembly protein LptD [Gemmatimonadota bacterium]|nr:MAG: LPS-assembly protein LptD [Gemmatimonadota bacterium]
MMGRGLLIGCATASILVVPGAGAAQEARPPPRTQQRERQPTDSLRQDSIPVPIDTAEARALGLPAQPSRSFPTADSIITALLELEDYGATRYAADSLTLFAETSEIRLTGSSLVEREGSILEADSVTFQQDDCLLVASGKPALFDRETVLVGGGMRYDTCERTGIVAEALTKFEQQGIDWYLTGELAVDSGSTRIYGSGTDVTTCQLATPHYHFHASNVKWVSDNVLVARPAVLYVKDVPVLWLPFIWQDMRQGRRSGLLVPRFGFNDLVRPNTGYRRHVSNIGYYFAISDYLDFQASLDWFSGNYVALNGQMKYRWLNRFLAGSIGLSRIFEEGAEGQPGSKSLRLQWMHQQSFNQRTRLTANVDYATSTRVIEQNSVDPLVQTATLGSRVNFSKQMDWGTLTIGASRSQDLANGTITQSLPDISLSPAPVNFGEAVTWSPSFSFSNNQRLNQFPGVVIETSTIAGITADTLFPDDRTTGFRLATPIRVGRWNWRNDFSVTDFVTNRPSQPVTIVDPVDSSTSTVYYGEDFSTGVDWNTGINLPSLFPSTWKLQPSVGVQNTTSGPFMIRNRQTGGAFVSQGKRLSFSASLSPTVFGFFPGVGPISRIRHSFSPMFSWNLAPAADVPEAYARAVSRPGTTPQLRSPTAHSISLGLSQTFEGKLRAAADDTTSDPRDAPKVKLLSIQTSAITYDFQQAKEPGRSGWTTGSIQNTFTSDLLRGFTLSLSHELWDGPIGYDSTRFDLFLRSVSARFTLTGATFANIFSLFTGGEVTAEQEDQAADPQDRLQPLGGAMSAPRSLDPAIDQLTARPTAGGGFRTSVTYDEQRTRTRIVDGEAIETPSLRNLGLQIGFSLTPGWSVSWNTNYNITQKEFGQHLLRLDRTMHRWRATFSFVKAPNGNFAFNFFISLQDQPEMKFQYDQRTVRGR